jgi:alkylation response protein AidB-like acyl-CoA dehydrogenase
MNSWRTSAPTALAGAPGSCFPEGEAFLHNARQGVDLPLPGHGKTVERFAEFRSQAAANPSAGRLYEAHADAVAILHESGRPYAAGRALAVWASGGSKPLRLIGDPNGQNLLLDGRKSFCGGASIVDAALVTADAVDGQRLVLVDLKQQRVRVDSSTWKSMAFADAGICTVDFLRVPIGSHCLIGPPNWYGSRAGFWHGAVGVAAVWAGIADSIVSRLPELLRHDDQMTDAALGEVRAASWAVGALLSTAATQIDRHPNQSHTETALSCRYAVRAHIDRIMQIFDQEVGPAGIAFNAEVGRTRQELALALSQSHGVRDLTMMAKAPFSAKDGSVWNEESCPVPPG